MYSRIISPNYPWNFTQSPHSLPALPPHPFHSKQKDVLVGKQKSNKRNNVKKKLTNRIQKPDNTEGEGWGKGNRREETEVEFSSNRVILFLILVFSPLPPISSS